MNLKSFALYTSILLFMVGFGLSLQSTILELNSSSYVVLSERSTDYMNSLTLSLETNNFNNIDNRTATSLQQDTLFLAEETDGSSSISDTLANLNFFKRIDQKVITPIKFVFNVPSFLLTLLYLPLEPFSIITNLINIVIYIGLITLIIWSLK